MCPTPTTPMRSFFCIKSLQGSRLARERPLESASRGTLTASLTDLQHNNAQGGSAAPRAMLIDAASPPCFSIEQETARSTLVTSRSSRETNRRCAQSHRGAESSYASRDYLAW